MVVRGKGTAARHQAPLNIRWGGFTGELIPQVEQYTYMGVTLQASSKWEAQIQLARDKTWGKANSPHEKSDRQHPCGVVVGGDLEAGGWGVGAGVLVVVGGKVVSGVAELRGVDRNANA